MATQTHPVSLSTSTVDHTPTWYTPAEVVALRLIPGITSTWTLASLRRTGAGPRYARVGNKIAYSAESIASFIESRTFRSTSEYSR